MDRMPEFAITALLAMAKRIMETPPNQVLETNGDPYLLRWYLERDMETGSVYLHKILRSDADEELHDHPGDNLSIILEGEMVEVTSTERRILKPGDVISRHAEFSHRLELTEPVTTMWIMGKRTRTWGFWSKEGDFVPAQEFFRLRGDVMAP